MPGVCVSHAHNTAGQCPADNEEPCEGFPSGSAEIKL